MKLLPSMTDITAHDWQPCTRWGPLALKLRKALKNPSLLNLTTGVRRLPVHVFPAGIEQGL